MTDGPVPASAPGSTGTGPRALVYLIGRTREPEHRARLEELLAANGFHTTVDVEYAWQTALSQLPVVIFDISARFCVIGRVRAVLEDPEHIKALRAVLGRDPDPGQGPWALELATGGSSRADRDLADEAIIDRIRGAIEEDWTP